MRYLSGATYDDYIEWYLRREKRKNPTSELPETAVERKRIMNEQHPGKIRAEFPTANWSVVLLDQSDLENLVFLDSDWTKQEGLTIEGRSRKLRDVANRAIIQDYLKKTSAEKHQLYYNAMKDCHFRLDGSSRLVIRRSIEGETKHGEYYLHDGSGRALSYLLLLKQESNVAFESVEAFLATWS